jgi:sugar lactone lactonase YvrE
MTAVERLMRLAALAGLVALSGCTGQPRSTTAAAPERVWPAPPEAPRIAFVQSVRRPADLGIKASALVRFGRWLTGSEKGNEPLVKPFGLALDEKDNLCVTDTGANAVCLYDRAKKQWRRFEGVGGMRFVSPVAVAKRQDVLYVVDSARACLVAFDELGKLRFATTNRLQRPSGLALLGDAAYVADSQRHCVVVFDLNGMFRSEFGRRGTGPGEFNFPTHIAVGAKDELLVTDSMNSRIQIVDAQGQFRAQVGSLGDSPGQFSRPKAAAVDSFGHIYAIDALFDNIQIFDREGRLLLNVGETGSQPGQFWLPNGLAITRSNEVYAADSYNRRIQIFKYVGPS